MTISEQRDIILKAAAKDLLYFGKTITPKAFFYDSPEFHEEMASLMMDRSIDQLCIEAPRGFAKSTLGVRFILHHIVFDPGDKVVIIQSKTQAEAINRLNAIKNILEYSKPFKDLFGYAGVEVAAQWTEKKIKSKICGHQFVVRAVGTGQPVRGTLETSEDLEETRITLYYLDDADDEDNTLTKEQMDKNYDKFSGGKEGLDTRTGRVMVVGTPVRQGCIVDRVYNTSGWVSRLYKSYEKEGDEINLLWEQMRSYNWLLTKKAEFEEQGKLSKFYSEYMCEIVGDEDQLFKEEYLQYWDGYLDGGVLHINKMNNREVNLLKAVNVFIGIDPASSNKQTADYSVTMPIAYDEDGNIYILPYFRKRVTPTAHAEQIVELVKTLKPTRGFVETVGYQEMLRVYLREKLAEDDLYLPGLERKFNPRTEKSARLEVLHPYFYNKKVYIKEGMTELVDEMLMYPRGKHDDLLDGLYYSTRGLLKPDHLPDVMDDSKYFPFQYYGNKRRNNWLRQ